jgi:DNA-binding transcriptional ArsR family regulator
MQNESIDISIHQISVAAYAIKRKGAWFTTRDVAASAKGRLNPRTVRRHLLRLVDIGLLERRRAFGGCRYTLVEFERLDTRARAYLDRLTLIRETFDQRKRSSMLSGIVGMLPI